MGSFEEALRASLPLTRCILFAPDDAPAQDALRAEAVAALHARNIAPSLVVIHEWTQDGENTLFRTARVTEHFRTLGHGWPITCWGEYARVAVAILFEDGSMAWGGVSQVSDMARPIQPRIRSGWSGSRSLLDGKPIPAPSPAALVIEGSHVPMCPEHGERHLKDTYTDELERLRRIVLEGVAWLSR